MTRIDGSTPSASHVAAHQELERNAAEPRARAAPAASRDAVAGGAGSARRAPGATQSALVPGARGPASPFGVLAPGASPDVPPLPMLAAPVGHDVDLAPTAEVLAALAGFESTGRLGSETDGETVTREALRVRTGLILGLSGDSGGETDPASELASRVAQALDTPDVDQARVRVATTLQQGQSRLPAGGDVNGFVQAVLRESYMLQSEILKDYAERVKGYNDRKRSLRAEIQRARAALGGVESSEGGFEPVDGLLEPVGDDDGTGAQPGGGSTSDDGGEPPEPIRTREELERYIADLEGALETTGEDAQLASLDLQNALQAQQQLMQTMSNISAMLHETAMAIIRKIGS